uniref:Ig-like domain-containing protein n=1 Tax=Mesocestoides corti TaxID=53468 RepID=A0A5K3FI43_MESCO
MPTGQFFVVLLILSKVLCQHELVITPEVTIYDEKPSLDTGRIMVFPNKTVVVEALQGESVIFICNIFNMIPNARVIWRRVSFDGTVTETVNDGLMSRDMSRWKIGQGKQTNSVRLEILVVDETYAGYYTCDCQYTGSVEPARAERILRVVAQAKVLPFKSSYTTTVTEGDRMTLYCEAFGIPQPVVYWSRTGGSSSLIRDYGISKPGEVIEFSSVLPEDAGEYMCIVENRLGIDYWPVKVSVRRKPYCFSNRQCGFLAKITSLN